MRGLNPCHSFVLPNGFVCVFTGILPIAHDEDGLATILGHEISHQILKHSAERVSGSLVCAFNYYVHEY